VTCGSALKLRHDQSKGYYLNSISANWGGGSGQQVVTLSKSKGEQSSLWQIKEAHKNGVDQQKQQCKAGAPILCGQQIRLTHIETSKNLHSHNYIPSVISGQQEVSAYGNQGEGDEGDDWIIVCEGEYWKRSDRVRFKHVQTNKYLSASTKQRFNQHNCPHCPIQNDLEVSCADRADHLAFFRTELGIFLYK